MARIATSNTKFLHVHDAMLSMNRLFMWTFCSCHCRLGTLLSPSHYLPPILLPASTPAATKAH